MAKGEISTGISFLDYRTIDALPIRRLKRMADLWFDCTGNLPTSRWLAIEKKAPYCLMWGC